MSRLLFVGRRPSAAALLFWGLAGCARPDALPHKSVVGPVAADCRSEAGRPPPGTVDAAMRTAINPLLSQLSLVLFHDPRPTDDDSRSEELAQTAGRLAACFLHIAQLRAHVPEASPAGTSAPDFHSYSHLARDSALALQHASWVRDRRGQEHWFMHLKETCQHCHDRYRPPQSSLERLEAAGGR